MHIKYENLKCHFNKIRVLNELLRYYEYRNLNIKLYGLRTDFINNLHDDWECLKDHNGDEYYDFYPDIETVKLINTEMKNIVYYGCSYCLEILPYNKTYKIIRCPNYDCLGDILYKFENYYADALDVDDELLIQEAKSNDIELYNDYACEYNSDSEIELF